MQRSVLFSRYYVGFLGCFLVKMPRNMDSIAQSQKFKCNEDQVGWHQQTTMLISVSDFWRGSLAEKFHAFPSFFPSAIAGCFSRTSPLQIALIAKKSSIGLIDD